MADTELVREFLAPYLDMLDGLSPTQMNRPAHFARLDALIARVRLDEAQWWAYLAWPERDYGKSGEERIKKWEQAAGGSAAGSQK